MHFVFWLFLPFFFLYLHCEHFCFNDAQLQSAYRHDFAISLAITIMHALLYTQLLTHAYMCKCVFVIYYNRCYFWSNSFGFKSHLYIQLCLCRLLIVLTRYRTEISLITVTKLPMQTCAIIVRTICIFVYFYFSWCRSL